MKDPFDEFQRADPFDEFQRAGPPTRTVLREAVQVKPDDYADAARLAKRYPAPVDTLYRNLSDIRVQEAVDQYDQTLQTSPKLAEHLRRNPERAKIAHDDIPALAKIESNFAQVAASSVGQAVLGISEGIWRTPDALQRGAGYLASVVEMTGLPRYLNPIRGVQDAIRVFSEGRLPVGPKLFEGTTDVANRIGDVQEMLGKDTQTFGQTFADVNTLAKNADQALQTALKTGNVNQVAEVLTDANYWSAFIAQAAPSLYMALKSGGSIPFLAWLEGMEQASNAADFEQKTGVQISDREFVQAVGQTAFINALLERYGVDKILGAQGKGLSGIVKAAFAEGTTEGLQQVNNNLAALLAYNPEQSLSEGVLASIMGGAGSGGGAATARVGAAQVSEILAKRQQQEADAQKFGDTMKALTAAANESVLRERDPEAFREALSAMSGDAKLYIDGEVLNQLPPEVLRTLPEDVQQQAADAAESGGMVEIRVADALTVAPGTALEQVLAENARRDPFSLSQAEVKQAGEQAQQFLKQEAERVIQQAQDQEAMRASAEVVRTSIKTELDTVGRFSPQVNEAMSQWAGAFYTTMASRVGMTPEAFYQKYRLRILGQALPGQQGGLMDQATPEALAEAAALEAEARQLQLGVRARIKAERDAGAEQISDATLAANRADGDRAFALLTRAQELRKPPVVVRERRTPAWFADMNQGQRAAVDALPEWDGADGFSLRRPGNNPEDDLYTSADSNFTDYDVVPGVRSVPLEALGDLEGYTEPNEQQRIQALADRMREDRQITPIFVGVDATGEMYVIEGQHRARAFKAMGMSAIPARVVVDFSEGRQERPLEQAGIQPVLRKQVTDKQGATFDVTVTPQVFGFGNTKPNALLVELRDPATGERRGFVDFAIREDGVLTGENVSVDKDFRQRDLAASMYQAARDAGYDIAPGRAQTDLGNKMVAGLQRRGIINREADGPRFSAGNFELMPLEQSADERNLVVVHNLTAANLMNADRLGGLPVPSIGITRVDAPFSGFGDISLIGGRGMVDPETGTPVFDSDAYTARFPDLVWKAVPSKKAQALVDKFRQDFKDADDRSRLDEAWDYMVNRPDRGKAVDAIERSVGGKLAYVRSLGEQVEIPMKAVPLRNDFARDEALGQWVRANSEGLDALQRQGYEAWKSSDLLREMSQQVEGAIERYFADLSEIPLKADLIASTKKDLFDDNGLLVFGRFDAILRDVGNADKTEVDRWGLDEQLRKRIEPERAKYEAWVQQQFDGLYPEPMIEVGRRKVPVTLENIVEAMTRGGVAGKEQGMTFGAGRARAAMAKRYRSIAEIQADRARIVDPQQHENAKKEAQAKVDGYQTLALQSYTEKNWRGDVDTWQGLDASMRALGAIGKAAKPSDAKIAQALRKEGFVGFGSDLIEAAREAALTMRNTPVDYLEAKPQRAVRLNEFAGAVVPDNTPQEALDVLARGNIRVATYTKGDEASRRSAIESLSRQLDQETGGQVLLQNPQTPRGTFNPQTLDLVLNPNADLSTFFHETGHFFLEVMADIASQPDAPAQIREDMDRVLAWFGVTDLGTWNAMTLDQKRMYHERWAESVEQYIMEGRAPSVELAPLMRRFAAWLKSVYGSIKQFLAGRGVATGEGGGALNQAPEGVLTDENGKPITLYHGTNKRFKKFNPAKSGANYAHAASKSGIFFTSRESYANAYAEDAADERGGRARVIPVHIKAKNPLEVFAPEATPPDFWYDDNYEALLKQAKDGGHDAIIVNGVDTYGDGEFIATVVVFDPKQIVSAISGEVLGQDPNTQPQQPNAIQLNDDIRRVMDRLLATDEQIAQAEQLAGMTPDVDGATGEALERLRARSMRDLKWAVNARDKVVAKLRKQAKTIEKTIRAEVTAAVDATPEMQAKAALDKVRRDTKAAPTDADLAVTADAFGFPSVDAMLRAIDEYGPRQVAIDGMTERRMLEEHGDLIDERAIAEAANEAVHNEARAKSLATELKAQADMLGARQPTGQQNAAGRPITVNALAEAARQFGERVVDATPLKDLKARAWQHTAAERRASKRWTEATTAGNTEEAVRAKQDQVLNNAAARAATDAQAEVRKIRDFFARVVKGNDETVVERGRDPDLVNAARAVLAAYGVQTPASKGAQAYLDALAKHDPETYNVVKPAVDQALEAAQPLDALTIGQLRALRDEIDSLWHLAKRSRQMEVDGDLMDIDDAAQDLFAKMEEIGIPDTIPGEEGALTRREMLARQWIQQAPALLRRVEQWAEAKDGKYGGPFLRFIFQPVKDAADRYRTARLDYRKRFQALVDNIAPTMRTELIEAPELGYTFGRGHNGIATAELLHAILHTGNDSNKRKLLLGRGWATELPDGTLDTGKWDGFIERMIREGKLTREHFDFAQGVWDLLEETKPLAQKTHRDVFGRYFAEVTANPVTNSLGTWRGGYVPAQADPTLVQDAELRELLETENASMSFAFPATARGFTKSRVEYNRPLKLDLRTLPQHIDKVLLFSHMEPAVRGVARLLRNNKVAQPLARIDPAAMGGMLKPWLNRAARQTVETPISADAGLNRMASTIRGRVGMALMFANVSNALQQITGFTTASVRVKPSNMMRAAAQFVANPRQFQRAVWDASPYMADRASNEVAILSDTLEAILINPSVYERAEHWTRRHAYFLQTAFDNVMSPIIWTGAYNQAMAEGIADRDAIRYADGIIRQTQGSTLPEDVSRIETGPAYARVFTQFMGYFNMLANTNATAIQQIARETGLRKGAGRALYVLLIGLMSSLWVAEVIAIAMRGGPDDEDDDGYLDDWIAAVFGFGTIKGILAGIPVVGQVAQSAVNRFNDQPADDKVSLSPSVSVLESAAGAPASVYKAIVDDASAQKAVRDVAALVTVTTGLPAMGLARPVGYLAGVADERIEPTSELDFVRGLITGTASPESKQQ